MCNISAIGLAIGAAGTISNTIAAKQQADAYGTYQSSQTQSALNNYIQQSKQLNTRSAQEQEASSEERYQIQIENMKAKATAEASAASSGIEGITIDNLFAGYDRATAVSNYTHARNLEMLGLEFNNQLDAYRNQALSIIYSMQSYSGATVGSTLLSGIGGLMTTYSNKQMEQERLNFYTNKQNTTYGVTNGIRGK